MFPRLPLKAAANFCAAPNQNLASAPLEPTYLEGVTADVQKIDSTSST
jgi:hypothetical protein